jgi:hypothetical protein
MITNMNCSLDRGIWAAVTSAPARIVRRPHRACSLDSTHGDGEPIVAQRLLNPLLMEH